MRFILFDIDGTLIDSGGAGTRSLNHAFRERFGMDYAFEGISMAGKTDTQILKEALAKYEISSDNGIIPEIMNLYLKYLAAEVDNPHRHMKPGVWSLLETLKKNDGVRLGLLTGNIERGARLKLDPFNLNGFFALGAFGSDDEDRNNLLSIAMKKYESVYNAAIDYEDCVVIGDTPKDVECSKPFGAVSIAVASGPYSYEALKATNADYVFEDLSDVDCIANLISSMQ